VLTKKDEPVSRAIKLFMSDQQPAPKVPHCEKCRRPMMLKFITLRLSEPGRMMIFQCIDCEKLAFIPAPPVR
jgi:hypothetical protein